MIKIFQTNEIEGITTEINTIEPNSWICLVKPTEEEIKLVAETVGISQKLISKVLDEEEMPRIEVGDHATLVVADTPFLNDQKRKNKYNTYPLGMIICSNNYYITVSQKEFMFLKEFVDTKIAGFSTAKKTRFTIQILHRIATLYLKDLRLVDQDIHEKEKVLYKSTKNKELIDLLEIEKTLVYFITSLKANDTVLEKLANGTILEHYPEDEALLSDAMIENKQGMEMANIYREILTSMTDTYATIISNNLNVVMKFLAGITIVFSIPTMIASFLGMNVPLGDASKSDFAFLFIVVISLIIAGIIAILLKKKDML